jgi:amidophosphoribosyltransferase
MACFTGEYPVPPPDAAQLGKHALEQPELPFDLPDAEGVHTGVPGGAVDALSRP